MKILFHSNAPWAPTGYGAQVRLIAPALAEHHDVAVSAFYGLEGARLNWEGIPVFPGLGGEFGNGYLVDHASHFFDDDPRGGIVLTLLDVWVMDPQNTIGQLNVRVGCRWITTRSRQRLRATSRSQARCRLR